MQEPGDKPADDNNPRTNQQELARIIATMDTDENIKRLAEQLFAEWKQLPENSQVEPDLSFAKFAERLKSKED